jgi:hypothetical protein
MHSAHELHHAVIMNGLQELSNATASGRQCRVVFHANGNEHWLLCTTTRITMDWPFASAPADNTSLRACFGDALEIEAWETDSYLRLIPACRDVESFVAGIDKAFQELYGLGPEYVLSYELEDAAIGKRSEG